MRSLLVSTYVFLFLQAPAHSQVMTYKAFRDDYNISIFDVFKTDLNGDHFSDFVILYGDRDPQKYAPLRCLVSNKEEKFFDYSDKCFPNIKTQHARNVIVADLLNNPMKTQLIIADHGPDVPPFVGGLSLVLQKSDDGLTFTNQTQKFLPGLKKQFTYSIASYDVNRDSYDDLYFAIFTNKEPFFKMFINQKNGTLLEDHSAFPKNDPAFKKCFMSAQFVDLDQDIDGAKELVLGGCNLGDPLAFSAKDLVLKKDRAGIYQVVADAFPVRHSKSGWGTNAFSFVDLNHDGLLDVVASIHDLHSSKGELRVYLNQKNLKFREIPVSIKVDATSPESFYIQKVSTTDLNNDGFPDLFFSLRDNSRRSGKFSNCVFVMLNDGKEHFLDVSGQLPIERHCYAAVDTLKNPNIDLQEMIFFDFDGTISSMRIPALTFPKTAENVKKIEVRKGFKKTKK